MTTCPVCEKEIPAEALQSDEYHYTGLAACPNCKSSVAPVGPPSPEMGFEQDLKAWFDTPESAREQFLQNIENDQTGRIVSRIMRSYRPNPK
jgi:hypothetical protein